MKVISGGQTGADQGALDAAIDLGLPHGGFCPINRRSESGPIPARFKLTALNSYNYAVRTERNVQESDATVIFTSKSSPGTMCTIRAANRCRKPYICLDPDIDSADLVSQVRQFVVDHQVSVLNVAGHRESQHPGIHDRVRWVLTEALKGFTA